MNKSYKFWPNIVGPRICRGKLILKEKHFYCWRNLQRKIDFEGETFLLLAKTFFFVFVFIQFRRWNYIIFTKVLLHAKCVWSRLQKCPPHAKFYNLSTGYTPIRITVSNLLSWIIYWQWLFCLCRQILPL